MSTNDFDWGRFVVRINVNASGKSLYDAWATRSGMEYWFLRLSEYRNWMVQFGKPRNMYKKATPINGFGMGGQMR